MTTDNFMIIKTILEGIDSQMDGDVICRDAFDYRAIGCSENRWNRLVEIMHEDGLIRGFSVGSSSIGAPAGKPRFENFRITLAGLRYLREQ